MYADPFIVEANGKTTSLQRVPFGSGFNEQWLQEKLFENPQSIPFKDIDPAYQDACPLCMEMNTGAGPIDIVYVTPQGRLIIVETKLWRNPEARRKVIGQILDYAKELKQWSYSDLQREVSRRTGIKGNSPYQLISEKYKAIDEASFVDGVTQSLQNGDFMLIVAGDGIRTDAQGIVAFLQESAHMRFVLGLVEVAVYKHPEKDLNIIQPRTLLKTQQVERDIGHLSTHESSLSEETPSDDDWRQQYKNFWVKFIDNLQLDDPDQPLPKPTLTGNVYLPLPPSANVAWITVYFFKKTSEVGVFIRFIDKPTGQELFESLLEMKDELTTQLPFEVEWRSHERRIIRKMIVEGEWPPIDNPEVSHFFNETINGLVNAFRPQLDRLSGN